MRLGSLLTGLVVFFAVQASHANWINNAMIMMSPCREDRKQLTNAYEVQGRNAWAAKCGYLHSSEQEFLNKGDQYIEFYPYRAPTHVNAECNTELRAMTMCSMPPASALSEDIIHKRCEIDDYLTTDEQVRGRNAWAFKCGYISKKEQESLDKKEQYVIFSEYSAPTNPDAGCYNIHRLAFCHKGCFTVSQRLLFSDGYIPIEEAVQQRRTNITTLSKGSTLNHMDFSETPIDFFVAGDHHGDIVVLTVDNGSRIEVTKNHPMVYATGDIVRADEIKVGESLLTITGSSVVTGIQYVHYEGRVLNVSPASQAVEEHISVAERFLTGSVRFQNEWADVEHRMLLRKTIHPQGL